jgi:hypothetical protein
MSSRQAKFTQSDAKRLFKAAAKAGVNVRVEFRSDGTIIATTGNVGTVSAINDVNSELDEWMEEHHAHSPQGDQQS